MPRKRIDPEYLDCPICKNQEGKPGITEIAERVCTQHSYTWQVSRCPDCGEGIFTKKGERGQRCRQCAKYIEVPGEIWNVNKFVPKMAPGTLPVWRS
jgi:hypothetical protein